jgi:uncharacterized protein (UPF0335 family)
MSNSQIKSIIDRILRLQEEVDAAKEAIREVYAEAKGNGLDKTVLGAAVLRIRKREAGKLSAVEQAEEERDLYVAAYDGTVDATHTHEAKP